MAAVHENVRRLVLKALQTDTPECGICLENFTHADATVMECCHVACKNCFKQLRKKECPFCRHKFAAQPRTPRETNREINLLRRDIAMLNNEVTFLERERDLLENRLRDARSARQRPVYTPVSPPYSPRRLEDFSPTPRFSPDPPPAEWQERVTTPEAPQPPTRTAARVLFGDESEDEDLVNLLGNDTDSESDSDVEVREVVQRAEPAPTAPRRQRGPCRCTLCNQIGHQRNNRRFHPINTLTN
ncbi:MAG: RING finger domain-containing protein [Ilumatobacteraceae bacterium]